MILLVAVGLVVAAMVIAGLLRLRAGRVRLGKGGPALLVGTTQAGEDLLARLGNMALMQVGHSRRIAESVVAAGRLHLFHYVCETGFEHRRQSHHWLVAAYAVEHGCSRATVTTLDWLIATAWCPACREIRLTEAAVGAEAKPRIIAIVEDLDEWDASLRKGLCRWFTEQPPERSWEIVPGFVVGYQTGQRSDETREQLGRATEELAALLKK
jgi:hypothetical protein